MTPAQRIEAYVRLRDYKKQQQEAFAKSMERTNQAMQLLENQLLQDLDASGAQSLACGAGTVYRTIQLSATVEDREEFMKHVRAHDNWDILDVKANKTAVREILEAGGSVPGVKITQYAQVGIRRA